MTTNGSASLDGTVPRRLTALVLALALVVAGNVGFARGADAVTYSYDVSGTVTDVDTEDPVAEICVLAYEMEMDDFGMVSVETIAHAITESDGQFSFMFEHPDLWVEVALYDCDEPRQEALTEYVTFLTTVGYTETELNVALTAGGYAVLTPIGLDGEVTGCESGWAHPIPFFDLEREDGSDLVIGPLMPTDPEDPGILFSVRNCVDADNPDARYLQTFAPGVLNPADATPTAIQVGEPASVEIELIPGVEISGSIFDAATGSDLEDCVEIYEHRDGVRTATSVRASGPDTVFGYVTEVGDVQLEFNECAFGGLPAVEGPTWPYVPQFYDGVFSLDEATHVTLVHGEPLDGLEVAMTKPGDDNGDDTVVESTGDEATEEDPVVVTVTSPAGGPVGIAVDAIEGHAPPGWAFLGRQVSIAAPDSTPGNPITIEFRLHASQLEEGQTADDVDVMRDGAFVEDCTGAAGVASPDPCVTSRVDDGDEVVITVLTSQASLWHLLAPVAACPDELELPFDDVSTTAIHAHSIACAAFRGIASGVGEGRYEPGRRVTRGQMATFVAQALAAAGYVLPEADDQGFTDVSGVHANSINRLVGAGIVQGRTATTFDPGGFVRRAQMATFLTEAFQWALGVELEAEDGPHFNDTEGNVHASNIDLAFELGLTVGAGGGAFAPGANVNRAPMATFLVNLLEALWPTGDAD